VAIACNFDEDVVFVPLETCARSSPHAMDEAGSRNFSARSRVLSNLKREQP
jgi:hypothetical protein